MRIRKSRLLTLLVIYGILFSTAVLWLNQRAFAGGGNQGINGGRRGAGAGAGRGGAGRAGAGRAGNAGAAAPAAPANNATPAADNMAFFESKIRPVLVKQCYECHAANVKDIGGGLLLDTRAGIQRGGQDGPAVVPGNVEGSLLIKALRYTNNDLQMPPSGKLPDSVIKDFETWVKMGAPDSRDGAATVAKTYDTEEAKKWWAFQPLKRPATPSVTGDWPRGDMDRFVLANLQASGLAPVADADKASLIRRASFDLIGLPPSPADVDAFVRDESPDAFAKVVDRLLASAQYGERWGRHWLDVARYAESTGKDINMTYPEAWRYRDYVIASFNSDKPYDQFIREQIAGDLLPAATPQKRAEQLIATGFLAVGPKGLDEQVSRQFALDVADEEVATTTQAFMGLTVACARCHDHKFDPIMQRDYYGVAGIFLSTNTKFGTVAGPRSRESSELIELPPAANEPVVRSNLSPQDRAKLEKDLADATTALNGLLASRGRGGAGAVVANQIQQAIGLQAHLQNELNAYDASGKPKAFCMGVEDRPPTIGRAAPMGAPATRRGPLARNPTGFETIADSPLFFRGEMSEPRDRVPRGVPVFLAWSGVSAIPTAESGRKELAGWIASARNPLTARVMANRLWLWLMGQGIVRSVDNFGTMGEAPSNPALLDYLAGQLIDNRWSIKKTIREIMLSRTYQLASTYNEGSYTIDPQNALLWRHAPMRLDAECLRDAMLMSSGTLDVKPPTGSLVALAGDGAISTGPPYMRINENQFINAAGFNRSVYLPAVRDLEPDALGLFDYPDSNTVNGDRDSTNVPSQALYLLNNNIVQTHARRMAQRIIASYPGTPGDPSVQDDRIRFAFRVAFGRSPSATELRASADFLNHMATQPNVNLNDVWPDFCLALYNTAEFRILK